MFLGMEWYWWLVVIMILIILLPVKIKFMRWWSERQKEEREKRSGKWGEDE